MKVFVFLHIYTKEGQARNAFYEFLLYYNLKLLSGGSVFHISKVHTMHKFAKQV